MTDPFRSLFPKDIADLILFTIRIPALDLSFCLLLVLEMIIAVTSLESLCFCRSVFCRKSWIIANIYVLCFISFFLILEMSYKDRTVLPIGCYISYSRYFGLYRRVCKAFTFFYSWLFWVCIIYCWDSLSYCYFSFSLSGTSFRLSIHNLVLSSLGGI